MSVASSNAGNHTITPCADTGVPGLERFGALVDSVAALGLEDPSLPPNPLPEGFGPWKPVERLGGGGMGEVFLVRRADGEYEALAALKRLRANLLSPTLRERFVRERQLLADLHHPHIATLLDGGVDSEGIPYFVLEYVDGRPITDFCDAGSVEIPQRLGLFTQVTDAVTAAHQRLIVHRDLKPDNILVGARDGVKLVDFGIAKLLDDPADAGRTATHERLLTPRYAAPEQLSGSAVTTATDVYGLGIVLFELLSGCRPLDDDAVQLALRSGAVLPDPPRMSVAFGRLDPDSAENAARNRGTNVRALSRTLRGDLDEIVAKALRPDAADRYPTVASLAADLARSARSESVEAHRGSTLYRLRKFWTRHWLPASTVTAVFAALAIALLVSVVKTEEARIAERRAAAINRFLSEELLGSADPGTTRGRDLTVREVLDRASRGAGAAFAAEPGVEESVRRTLGALSARLGDTERAHEQLAAARALLDRAGADRGERARLAQANAELAFAEGRFDLARAEIEAAAAGLGAVLGEDASETLQARIFAGRILVDDDDVLEAERSLRDVVARLDHRHADLPVLGASARVQLASALKAQGRRDEALAELVEASQLQQIALGADHPDFAQTLEQMAHIYSWIGRFAEAESAARRALEIDHQVFGVGHWRSLRGAAFLAEVLVRGDRPEEARKEATAALASAAPTLGDGHPEVVSLRNTLAVLATRAGDFDQATALYRAALSGAERTLGPAADLSMMIRRNFSNFLAQHGSTDESLALAQEVRALGVEAAAGERPDPMYLANVAWFLATAELPAGRDLDAALELARRAVDGSRGRWYYPWVALSEVRARRGELEEAIAAELRAVSLPDGLHLPGEDRYLVDLFSQRGDLEGAERFLRQQLERRSAVRPAGDPLLGHTRALLGRVLLGQNHLPEAERLLRDALSSQNDGQASADEWRIPALSDLGAVLAAAGSSTEAGEMLRQAQRRASESAGAHAAEELALIDSRLAKWSAGVAAKGVSDPRQGRPDAGAARPAP